MTREHRLVVSAFVAGIVLATLLASIGLSATVGVSAMVFVAGALLAGLVDAWRVRRSEWAEIDARHAADQALRGR